MSSATWGSSKHEDGGTSERVEEIVMLTVVENERLTRVGSGTPMGELMRRYWHPVAGVGEMRDPSTGSGRTKRVRILGEDLVLFKDRSGRFGLVGETCPHRRASLAYGIPTETGIRCPYHGWQFDGSGRCTEQPNEPAGSAFKDKVRTAGYPLEELAGLLWAYLGPLPAPLLPRYDAFVEEPAIRHVGQAMIPCNWLQTMENSVDAVHTEWLHGNLHEFLREQSGEPVKTAMSRRHLKVAFDEFRHGIIKRRLMEGQSETDDDWQVGHPLVFPNMASVGSGGGLWKQYFVQIRVPIDDTNTLQWSFQSFIPPKGTVVPPHLLERVPIFEIPYLNEQGEYMLEYIHAQDIMAFISQGAIADRSREALNSTDRGVTLYRTMLRREMENVAAGKDPLAVVRDPETNRCIVLPLEKKKDMFKDGFASFFKRGLSSFSPVAAEILAVMEQPEKDRLTAR